MKFSSRPCAQGRLSFLLCYAGSINRIIFLYGKREQRVQKGQKEAKEGD